MKRIRSKDDQKAKHRFAIIKFYRLGYTGLKNMAFRGEIECLVNGACHNEFGTIFDNTRADEPRKFILGWSYTLQDNMMWR